jgi:hypothetical protein
MLKQYGRWGERFKEKTRLFSMHRPCIRRRAARQAAPKRVLNKSKRRKRRGKDILENLAGNDPGGKAGISQVRGEFCPAPPKSPSQNSLFPSFAWCKKNPMHGLYPNSAGGKPGRRRGAEHKETKKFL